jgi:hypothetical protein
MVFLKNKSQQMFDKKKQKQFGVYVAKQLGILSHLPIGRYIMLGLDKKRGRYLACRKKKKQFLLWLARP